VPVNQADARPAAVGRLAPYGLTCELLETPLGIDEPRPRLSWRLASPRRGDAQAAYRLRVALRVEDLDDQARLVWDSGRVSSGDSLHAIYDGAPLQSSTRYHWRVTVWDADGRPPATAESWFETGLLHPGEWVAAWIGHDPAVQAPRDPPGGDDRGERTRRLEPCPHLRRRFTLAERPLRARAYASARGLYELRVNGRRVGEAELAPGWTEYRRRVLYQTYDVTELLQQGENVIGAVLADGWWSGYVGFDPRRPARHYGDAPQLIVQLVVDFAGGSRWMVVTDGGWRERPGPIRYADLLMGERHDAREQLPGWDRPGYDDGDWTTAVVVDRDTSVLCAASDRPVKVIEELAPVSFWRGGDDRFIADLGQNIVGRVRLTIRGAPRGQRVRLRHAEMLDEDGELYVANLRTAEASDVYVAGGEPVEVFEPRFTCHGFRYVEVSGYPGELRQDDVVGRVLRSDTPLAGEFRCSDAMVMRLQANIRWSQRGNFVAVPTDCPQRDERLGWLADAQVFLPTACRNADVAAFMARWMRDVVGAQDSDGAFPDVAPKLCVEGEGAPGWGDGGVIIPWQLYRAYGDVRVLERSFDAMVAWVERIYRHNPDLIWRDHVGNHYGDWLQVDAHTPGDVLATAYFARSAQLLAAAAEVLGRREAAKRYGELHTAIRGAFVDAFVDAGGRVTGGTQTGYLLALAFDLLPQQLVGAAVGQLVADIEARGRHLSTGFLGVGLLCPVLTEHGHADLAYALLHQDTYPSWGYAIGHGATTIWERWDGWTAERGFQTPAMNSFNHYALGAVGDWLYGRVAGIDQRPGSVAYRHLLLRPTVGGRLGWARAWQESPRGRVACGWHLSGDQVGVDVQVPPGVSAVLHVPTGDPASVREGGTPAAGSPGVRVVDRLPAALVVALASGSYHFTAARPRGGT
jgi:alpha-L-rhamnosidase